MKLFLTLMLALLVAASSEGVVRVTDTTVVDTDHGLEWQLATPGMMRWRDGMNYCKELTLNDRSDWRLPSKAELELGSQLADYFKKVEPVYYWTSTDYEPDREKSWLVHLLYGFVAYDNGGFSYFVKCVRTFK